MAYFFLFLILVAWLAQFVPGLIMMVLNWIDRWFNRKKTPAANDPPSDESKATPPENPTA